MQRGKGNKVARELPLVSSPLRPCSFATLR
jgi:hypothetical protein